MRPDGVAIVLLDGVAVSVQSSREDLPLRREVRRRASASSDPPALEPTRARLL